MAKLSDESKKKISDSVKKSWALRRARMAKKAKAVRRLSADAKRRISEAVKRSWASRRAGRAASSAAKGGGVSASSGVLASIRQASRSLRSLTLDDLRPLAGRKDAAAHLDELAGLVSDLRRLIAR
ncbi:MAG: hypothetical protein ACOYXU_12680 [Nitrospirota bacterium]